MKFLIGLLFVQLNVIAAGFIIAWGGGMIEDNNYRLRMIAAEKERAVTEFKHEQLIRQIKKEGLWNRLGMSGQPWLR